MSKQIEIQAAAVVDAAGAAGGLEEVRRIAERGWPTNIALENDSAELRAAIQARAAEIVAEA